MALKPTPEAPAEFTARQLAYLERLYPEQLALPAIPVDQIRFNAGQRSVLMHIRTRLQK